MVSVSRASLPRMVHIELGHLSPGHDRARDSIVVCVGKGISYD